MYDLHTEKKSIRSRRRRRCRFGNHQDAHRTYTRPNICFDDDDDGRQASITSFIRTQVADAEKRVGEAASWRRRQGRFLLFELLFVAATQSFYCYLLVVVLFVSVPASHHVVYGIVTICCTQSVYDCLSLSLSLETSHHRCRQSLYYFGYHLWIGKSSPHRCNAMRCIIWIHWRKLNGRGEVELEFVFFYYSLYSASDEFIPRFRIGTENLFLCVDNITIKLVNIFPLFKSSCWTLTKCSPLDANTRNCGLSLSHSRRFIFTIMWKLKIE